MKTSTLSRARRTQCTHRLTAAERGILNASPAQRHSLDLAAVPAYLREEWEHFKGYGWSDQRTAQRLGLQADTVNKWAARHAERIARQQLADKTAAHPEDSPTRALQVLPAAATGAGTHQSAIAQAIAC